MRLVYYSRLLEFCVVGGAGEGDYVADVCHAGNEKHQTLESEAESGVGHSAEAAGVEIPPHIFHRYIEFFDTGEEFVVVGFALATADDFVGLRIARIIALPDLKQLF